MIPNILVVRSDEKAVLVRKHHTENQMKVRVPTGKLSNFLIFLNDNSSFLHNRKITAKDVSASIKYAQMEKQRQEQNQKNLQQIKPSIKNAEVLNDNACERNIQEMQNTLLTDDLKYSVVNIYLKEPKSKITQIEIPNIEYQENQYKISFGYQVKEAFSDGFYHFQRFLIFLAEACCSFSSGGYYFFFGKKEK